MVKVSQLPMPQVGVSRSLYYQLWYAAAVGEIQRTGVEVVR